MTSSSSHRRHNTVQEGHAIFCEYYLWVRFCNFREINGYYIFAGLKSNRLSFIHQQNAHISIYFHTAMTDDGHGKRPHPQQSQQRHDVNNDDNNNNSDLSSFHNNSNNILSHPFFLAQQNTIPEDAENDDMIDSAPKPHEQITGDGGGAAKEDINTSSSALDSNSNSHSHGKTVKSSGSKLEELKRRKSVDNHSNSSMDAFAFYDHWVIAYDNHILYYVKDQQESIDHEYPPSHGWNYNESTESHLPTQYITNSKNGEIINFGEPPPGITKIPIIPEPRASNMDLLPDIDIDIMDMDMVMDMDMGMGMGMDIGGMNDNESNHDRNNHNNNMFNIHDQNHLQSSLNYNNNRNGDECTATANGDDRGGVDPDGNHDGSDHANAIINGAHKHPPQPGVHNNNTNKKSTIRVMNEDLPVQVLDIVFRTNPNKTKLGFGIRVDTDRQIIEVNNIDTHCEAYEVGLKQGDIIIAVNEEPVGTNVKRGLELLHSSKSEDVWNGMISITICRRIFDNIMIVVQRAGFGSCNGRYYFHHLDEYDCPIFMQDFEDNMDSDDDDEEAEAEEGENDGKVQDSSDSGDSISAANDDEDRIQIQIQTQTQNLTVDARSADIDTGTAEQRQMSQMRIRKANYDKQSGDSLWTISDENNDYYISVSRNMMPPNFAWEPVEHFGKYPAPGLVFFNRNQRLMQNLAPHSISDRGNNDSNYHYGAADDADNYDGSTADTTSTTAYSSSTAHYSPHQFPHYSNKSGAAAANHGKNLSETSVASKVQTPADIKSFLSFHFRKPSWKKHMTPWDNNNANRNQRLLSPVPALMSAVANDMDPNNNDGNNSMPRKSDAGIFPLLVVEEINKLRQENLQELTEAHLTIQTLQALGDEWKKEVYEWKNKYKRMHKKCSEFELLSREYEYNAVTLFEQLQDMNQSFYQYWIRDKKHDREKERYKDIIRQQRNRFIQMRKELFQQKRREEDLLDKINALQSHSRQVSTLSAVFGNQYDIDIEEMQSMYKERLETGIGINTNNDNGDPHEESNDSVHDEIEETEVELRYHSPTAAATDAKTTAGINHRARNSELLENLDVDNTNMQTIDLEYQLACLHTEIEGYKAQIASKNVEITELTREVTSWQENHRQIYGSLAEAQRKFQTELNEQQNIEQYYIQENASLKDGIDALRAKLRRSRASLEENMGSEHKVVKKIKDIEAFLTFNSDSDSDTSDEDDADDEEDYDDDGDDGRAEDEKDGDGDSDDDYDRRTANDDHDDNDTDLNGNISDIHRGSTSLTKKRRSRKMKKNSHSRRSSRPWAHLKHKIMKKMQERKKRMSSTAALPSMQQIRLPDLSEERANPSHLSFQTYLATNLSNNSVEDMPHTREHAKSLTVLTKPEAEDEEEELPPAAVHRSVSMNSAASESDDSFSEDEDESDEYSYEQTRQALHLAPINSTEVLSMMIDRRSDHRKVSSKLSTASDYSLVAITPLITPLDASNPRSFAELAQAHSKMPSNIPGLDSSAAKSQHPSIIDPRHLKLPPLAMRSVSGGGSASVDSFVSNVSNSNSGSNDSSQQLSPMLMTHNNNNNNNSNINNNNAANVMNDNNHQNSSQNNNDNRDLMILNHNLKQLRQELTEMTGRYDAMCNDYKSCELARMDFEQQLNMIGIENERIIDSKIVLIEHTSNEIQRLNAIINVFMCLQPQAQPPREQPQTHNDNNDSNTTVITNNADRCQYCYHRQPDYRKIRQYLLRHHSRDSE